MIAWLFVGCYKLMDNFHLQVTPLELTYQSKSPITLSCVIKKVMPSGGAPERREIHPTSKVTSGRATFQEGVTFAMNKEMELRNTKISLNFFNKNDNNAFLIGSTDLQVASLPAQSYSLLDLKLDNCSDPKAKLKLEIQRKETEIKQDKKENSRPHQMGILRTQGQLWQQTITKSRVNPSIPTAYQISRRNYVQKWLTKKQAQVSCHEQKKSESRKSISGKKGSYLQQRVAVHGKALKQSNVKNEERSGQSPMPRKQTPEPIRIGTKQEVPKPSKPVHKYAISKVSSKANHSHTSSSHTQPTVPFQQPTLEPERLKIRPYREDENVEKVNREGCIRSLEEEKKHKYRTITDKLQMIHDKIAQSKERVEQSESSSQCEMSHNHRSYFEERQGRIPPAAVNSFTHLSAASSNVDTPNILKDSQESSSQKEQQVPNLTSANVEKQFQNVKSVKTKSPDNSPPSQKTVSFKTIPEKVVVPPSNPHKDTSIDTIMMEREEEQIELQSCRQEIQRLKSDLSSALRLVGERDSTIKELQEEVQHYRSLLQEKQGLLDRLNHEYELRFEEIFSLKERVAAFEQQRNRISEEKKQSQQATTDSGQPSKLVQSLSGQLLKAKKRILESQSQLKFKENENRCLSLEIDNVKREKRNLEQEIQVLVSRDKNEMTRKASLARIEQINNNSLATHAKRENEALRNEVKLLQQKLESLNGLFESLLSPEEKAKAMGSLQPSRDSSQVERRVKLLQEKCGLLEEELKNKKNQLAEVINVIWKHEDGDIMNEVLTVISGETPPA